jgi:hypothetical protein
MYLTNLCLKLDGDAGGYRVGRSGDLPLQRISPALAPQETTIFGLPPLTVALIVGLIILAK